MAGVLTRSAALVLAFAALPLQSHASECGQLLHTGLDGHDLRNLSVPTVADCCDACTAEFGCTGFTVYQGVCYLKASNSGSSTCDGCTSGTRPSAGCALLSSTNLDGNDIASAAVLDAGECCYLCSITPECTSWTLWAGVCYMKEGQPVPSPCSGCTSGVPAAPGPTPPPLPAKWHHAGMTFTGGRYCPNVTLGSAASNRSLGHLATTGATWVAVVSTQYQWNISSKQIFPLYNRSAVRDVDSHYYVFVTETEASVRATIQEAHRLGFRVMLKPHIDLLRDNKPLGRYWRGDIGKGFGPQDWDEWFGSYAAFFLPYARLAEQEGVELLSMNCELVTPNLQEAHWRALVKATRAVYSGLLTTSAISGHEKEVQWWDALDVIGSDNYRPVPGDSVAQMVASLRRQQPFFAALAARFGRNVTFTEIGYCSGWCSRTHVPSRQDYVSHASHFKALFEAYRGVPWFMGSFWWNWDSDPGFSPGDDCLTPQFKPAEAVLRGYYRATQPQPARQGPALCIGEHRCTC